MHKILIGSYPFISLEFLTIFHYPCFNFIYKIKTALKMSYFYCFYFSLRFSKALSWILTSY